MHSKRSQVPMRMISLLFSWGPHRGGSPQGLLVTVTNSRPDPWKGIIKYSYPHHLNHHPPPPPPPPPTRTKHTKHRGAHLLLAVCRHEKIWPFKNVIYDLHFVLFTLHNLGKYGGCWLPGSFPIEAGLYDNSC